MKSDPKDSMQLLCTYWGSDKDNREFDILVNEVVIGTQEINGNKPGEFFDVIYQIPAVLTKGKDLITVKFQPKKNKIAGSVYKVRVLRTVGVMTADKVTESSAPSKKISVHKTEKAPEKPIYSGPMNIAKTAVVTASVTQSNTANFKIYAINDEQVPQNSADARKGVWHTFPNPGKPFWIQYDFAVSTKVKEIEVYWFDESARNASCRLPQSWKLMAKIKGDWTEVKSPSGYGVELNKFNKTTFKPVLVDALRIEGISQEKRSSGLIEWKVN
jgi:hypothetical protein